MAKDLTRICELIDLVQTNKPAALALFSQEYESVPFVLTTSSLFHDEKFCIDLIEQRIEIKSYSHFKKFIDVFGSLVKNIHIEIHEFTTFKLTKVFNYIRKHCTSLKTLRLYDKEDDNNMFEPNVELSEVMIGKPLRIKTAMPSLETFFASHIYLKTKMKLNACFPQLRSLHLQSIAVADPSFIEVNMPNLTTLGIVLDSVFDECDEDENCDDVLQLDRNNVENVIRLNPQLKCVRIEMEMDTKFLEFLRDSLPTMENLSLSLDNCDFDNYNGADIVFENVVVLCLDDLSQIDTLPPITSENLAEIETSAGDNTTAFDFIKKHHSIKVLRLDCEYSAAQVLELIAALPNLKTLHLTIEEKEWKLKDVVDVLTECELLDNVQVTVDVDSTEKRLRSRFTKTWEIQEDDAGSFTFEKV